MNVMWRFSLEDVARVDLIRRSIRRLDSINSLLLYRMERRLDLCKETIKHKIPSFSWKTQIEDDLHTLFFTHFAKTIANIWRFQHQTPFDFIYPSTYSITKEIFILRESTWPLLIVQGLFKENCPSLNSCVSCRKASPAPFPTMLPFLFR